MCLPNTFSSSKTGGIPPAGTLRFVGIGGVGMCGLALLCRDCGYRVSGSDAAEGELLELLRREGIPCTVGSAPEQAAGWDGCVYTLALSTADREVKAAMAAGVPVFSRADFLGGLSRAFACRVGVAGTHGKSTVTAMTGDILAFASRHPAVLCGARMAGGSVYRPGKETLVYEACEYRDSFLATHPTVAVVTNLEYDHPDWFRTMAEEEDSFSRYLHKPGVTRCVLPAADTRLLQLAGEQPVFTFGTVPAARVRGEQLRQEGGRYAFVLYVDGERVGPVRLSVPGRHQVDNALCAAAAALAGGVPKELLLRPLSGFAGIHRRMEYKGQVRGVAVFDDYAHHPTEIAAAVRCAREMAGGGRVLCLFQPHTFSRTEALFDDFAATLATADAAGVLPVYAAREQDPHTCPGQRLAAACGGAYVPDAAAAGAFFARAGEGDIFLLLGAGDVGRLWETLRDVQPS